MEDFDSRLPPTLGWNDAIAPYLRSEDLFTCPSVRADKGTYGYAYYSALALQKTNGEKEQRQIGIFFDANISRRSLAGGRELLPVTGRHSKNRNNVCFLDTHSVSFQADDPVWNSILP
jgi:hypothetical protein